ncbi:Carbohydrate porin [Sphingomonas antarctica]|uniref:carbohydrate porin n=1 Tax=Sphingomonas antarctica TaxID=2040274 RepID=UPI0039E9C75A
MTLAFASAALSAGAARADDPPPTVSLAMRDTMDAWAVPVGAYPGSDVLNKLQLSATVAGDRSGLSGWIAHAQVFRTDGTSLSARLGDIQTADNIEADRLQRLFEAWVQKTFGAGDRTLSLRGGLLDYNADFDSTATASLFLNSSHGIGADVARSGRNGPSIFPVSSLGIRATFSPSKTWTFRLAAYDGVPGDPDHPRRFSAVRLGDGDGALLALQIDAYLTDKSRAAIGVWRYTAPVTDPTKPSTDHADQGVYAAIEGPLPGHDKLSAWARVGVANRRTQAISGYIGTGLVAQGLVTGRPDDKLGIAVARATLARLTLTGPYRPAETSIETTYQVKISDTFAFQPDLQYILNPAVGGTHRALAAGLRFIVTAGYPRKAKADDASDPTVPPDGPQPPDQNSAPNKPGG